MAGWNAPELTSASPCAVCFVTVRLAKAVLLTPVVPGQVEIFFPERGHPAFGVLRASLADSNDTSPVFTYLDSDDMVNDNNRRPFVDHRANAQSPAMDRTLLTDGLWHMATVTTQPNGTKGYRCSSHLYRSTNSYTW